MERIPRRRFLQQSSAVVAAALLPHGLLDPPRASLATTPTGADFPKLGGNLGNQNYTSLDRIRPGNVGQLGGAWLNGLEGGRDTGVSQSSAIALNGVLYLESGDGSVYAVDGATGATKWKYEQTGGALTRRGVAVGEGKVFTLGNPSRVIALDQETGKVVWEKAHTGLGNIQKVGVIYHDGKLYLGNNDSNRGVALAVSAADGSELWHFWSTPGPGERGNETWEGDSWMQGGATPWVHPAVDPELGLVYYTFGNVRGNRSSQDGSQRGGMNLFANSIVALEMATGRYRWHFQSVHHDIWDMDNVMSPVLADVQIGGRERKIVVYGSKSGMYFVLDRTDGSAPLGIEERPVPQEPRQKTWPTQPFPRQGGWMETRLVEQPLGTEVPGHPARAVPNFRKGDIYTPHWDEPVLSIPGHGGGADWSAQSFSHRTGLVYTGYGYVAAAHSLTESANGLRPPGEYMTGGIVAVDASTNQVKWRKLRPYELGHGNGILTTASDLLFIGEPDGNLLALDARDGIELWRFQTGAAIVSSPLMYEANGEHYVAVFAGGTGIPYGASAPRGDYLWAFKLGGAMRPVPAPPAPVVRRPVVGAAVEGSAVENTIVLGRSYNAATREVSAAEVTGTSGYAPTYLRVPAGTTVTFRNHPGNAGRRGATQFFEGLFNVDLAPGETFRYTFAQRGEFFFNDPHAPRAAGKVEVY
jgi:PQQ-dependent dehydrogenase (methanol/ethanol family)